MLMAYGIDMAHVNVDSEGVEGALPSPGIFAPVTKRRTYLECRLEGTVFSGELPSGCLAPIAAKPRLQWRVKYLAWFPTTACAVVTKP